MFTIKKFKPNQIIEGAICSNGGWYIMKDNKPYQAANRLTGAMEYQCYQRKQTAQMEADYLNTKTPLQFEVEDILTGLSFYTTKAEHSNMVLVHYVEARYANPIKRKLEENEFSVVADHRKQIIGAIRI